MDAISFIGLGLLAGIGFLFFQHRRHGRLPLTQHTVDCPEYGDRASLAVRTDANACPSRRHVDVATCSLLPPASSVRPTRTAYLPDVPAAGPYPDEVDQTPRHSDGIRCPKRCLAVLNAGENGAGAEPIRCTSGMSDGLELARQSQTPAIMRALWYHST